jgi:hypothetical protein
MAWIREGGVAREACPLGEGDDSHHPPNERTVTTMSYRHSNGRIQHRGGGGRFRHSTLADVGLGECDKCGKLFVPDYSDLGPIIDPRVMRERQRTCRECLGLPPVSTLDGVVESESKREGPIVVAIYNADLVEEGR